MATLKTPRKAARKLKPAKPANRQAGKPGNPGPALVQSMRSLEHHVQTGTVSDLKQTTHAVPPDAATKVKDATTARLALIRELKVDAFVPPVQAQIDLGGGTLAHVVVLGEHTTDTGSVFACLPIDVSPTMDNIQWRAREDIKWSNCTAVPVPVERKPAASNPATASSLEHTVRELENEWANPTAIAGRAQVVRDNLMAAGIAMKRYDDTGADVEALTAELLRSTDRPDAASIEHAINTGRFDVALRRHLLAKCILRLSLRKLA